MSKLWEKIRHHKWLIVFSAFILTATTLPYLYGIYSTSNDEVFTGVVSISHYDTYTYLAWIEQAKQGLVLFKSLYSTETAVAIFFHPFFLLLGLIGKMIPISNILLYHGSRIILGVLFLYTFYGFLDNFKLKKQIKDIALVLLASSSGIGFIVSGLSADLWMTEYISFLSLYQSPLNLLSMVVMLLILSHILKFKFGNSKNLILAALWLNLLILIHPYDYVIIIATSGLYVAWLLLSNLDKISFKYWLWLIALSFPGLLWQEYVLIKNSTLGIWASFQTNVPSPDPANYLTGLGLLLVFLFIGIIALHTQKKLQNYRLLLAWLIIVPVLLYLPFLERVQRKFSEGLHIPIVIFAGIGVYWWYSNMNLRSAVVRKILLGLTLILLAFGNIFVVNEDLKKFSQKIYPYYIKQEEMYAMNWLKSNSQYEDTLLSGYSMGNLIPGLSGRQVYLGNGDQTVNFSLKYDIVYGVLSQPINHSDPLKKFVSEEQINYIFEDEEVRSWGGLDVTNRDYLKLVYENSDVKIYEIDQNLLN